MSGTSLDGIDVAIVDIGGRGYTKKLSIVATLASPYPEGVREALLGVSNTMTHTASISRLNFLLGELYAERFLACCKRRGVPRESVQLIGCHGQTIYHEGRPAQFLGREIRNTMQIGEPAVIAERTGIDVVSNFRERDIAAGGQGAPLVPLLDYILFRDAKRGRIALNLGGIANLTAIPAKASIDELVACDTGPANMIIDQLVARLTNGKQKYDRGGAIARKGKVHERMLESMLSDRFFTLKPPKSAGREQFGSDYVNGLIGTSIPLEDLITTASLFTARSVTMAIEQVSKRARYHDLIVGGGGAHNRFLMDALGRLNPGLHVATPDAYGVDADFKEAAAFAVLAHETVLGRPGNVRGATGAKRSVQLGRLTRA